MKKVYAFYEDPGHGWLKVERAELIRLGILDKVSGYSYQRNGMVYLEEDRDLSVFYNAKLQSDGVRIETRTSFAKNQSGVRNYDSFDREKDTFKINVQAGPCGRHQSFFQKGETLENARCNFLKRLSAYHQSICVFVD